VIEMPAVDKSSTSLKAVDELVHKLTSVISEGSHGNYAALLTGPPTSGAARRRLESSEMAPLTIERDLLTALLIGAFLFVIFFSGFCCLFSLQTPKKFDEVSKVAE